MKKTLLWLVVVAVWLSGGVSGRIAAAESGGTPAYTLLIPLEYEEICLISGDFFVTLECGETQMTYTLRQWDGTPLLEDLESIQFAGDYIVAQQDDWMGVLTRDLEVLVPFVYKKVYMTDEHLCLAIIGDEYRKPHTYYGDMFLYDLRAGGYEYLGKGDGGGWPDYWLMVSRASQPLLAQGFAGVIVKDGEVYNGDGQLLLEPDTGVTIGYGAAGRFLYGQTGQTHMLYTGRGRWIAAQEHIPFVGLYGGLYSMAFDYGDNGPAPYIIDNLGSVVIEPGRFDSYAFNCATDMMLIDMSDDDRQVIVSKDGRYGVIALHDRVPYLPGWARDGVMAAIDRGLVPDDVVSWVYDSCTREEFCRMLALAVQAVTGESMETLAAGLPAVSFLDSTAPAVLTAASLGIVKGVGHDLFAPYRFITREEAAVMLARAAAVLGMQPSAAPAEYGDEAAFASWSVYEIRFVSQLSCGDEQTPLMQGTGKNLFSPKSMYTVDQSILTMLRLTEADVLEAAEIPEEEPPEEEIPEEEPPEDEESPEEEGNL